MLPAGRLLGLHFYPEDGSNMLLRNVGELLPDYTGWHRKDGTAYSQRWQNLKSDYVRKFVSIRSTYLQWDIKSRTVNEIPNPSEHGKKISLINDVRHATVAAAIFCTSPPVSLHNDNVASNEVRSTRYNAKQLVSTFISLLLNLSLCLCHAKTINLLVYWSEELLWIPEKAMQNFPTSTIRMQETL
jgi:hypothetical protein